MERSIVKYFSFHAPLVAGLLLAIVSLMPRTAPAGTGIVLVDIPKVFENHQRFKDRMAEIKQDVQKFDTYLRGERQKLAAREQEREKQPAGSAARKQIEAQLTQAAADLEVRRQLEVKNVREREARVYLEAYQEVVQHVSVLSARYGASLVMRYSSKPIDGNRRDSIMVGVNRPVVYQDRLDITQQVIDRLNRGLAPKNIGQGFVPPRR